jgi:hypothetical protein
MCSIEHFKTEIKMTDACLPAQASSKKNSHVTIPTKNDTLIFVCRKSDAMQ